MSALRALCVASLALVACDPAPTTPQTTRQTDATARHQTRKQAKTTGAAASPVVRARWDRLHLLQARDGETVRALLARHPVADRARFLQENLLREDDTLSSTRGVIVPHHPPRTDMLRRYSPPTGHDVALAPCPADQMRVWQVERRRNGAICATRAGGESFCVARAAKHASDAPSDATLTAFQGRRRGDSWPLRVTPVRAGDVRVVDVRLDTDKTPETVVLIADQSRDDAALEVLIFHNGSPDAPDRYIAPRLGPESALVRAPAPRTTTSATAKHASAQTAQPPCAVLITHDAMIRDALGVSPHLGAHVARWSPDTWRVISPYMARRVRRMDSEPRGGAVSLSWFQDDHAILWPRDPRHGGDRDAAPPTRAMFTGQISAVQPARGPYRARHDARNTITLATDARGLQKIRPGQTGERATGALHPPGFVPGNPTLSWINRRATLERPPGAHTPGTLWLEAPR